MSRFWRRWQQPLVVGCAVLIVGATSGLPLLCLAGELAAAALSPGGEGPPVAELLVRAPIWRLLLRSSLLAAAVTAGALALGAPLGFLLAKTDVHLARPCWLLHAFPLFVPPFLVALGAFYLFGRRGLLGGEASARLLFSDAGVVAVLVLTFAPIVSILTGIAVAAVDPALEEAARVVARPWRVASGIFLPSARPAVALAALLVFSLAFAELGVPMFLRSRVYPEAVFARLGGIDYAPGEAAVLASPLLIVGAALVLVERRVFGRRRFALLGLRPLREPLRLGRWRLPATLLVATAAVAAAAPFGALAWRAADGGLAQLPDWTGQSPWNSLAVAASAAAVATLFGTVLGHALVRRQPGTAAVDAVLFLAFLVPAPVLGVGLIATWNRPATQGFYRSLAILVVAAVARYAVVAVRGAAVTFAQSSPRLEEAARVGGAGYLRRLLGIVVPLHARGLCGVFLLVFLFCLRDLETAVPLYPPGGEPLTVRIFTLEANGPEPVVAALALLQVLITAGALGAGLVLLSRSLRRRT